MRQTLLPLLALVASSSVIYVASAADVPPHGRYQLGGTERDGLILLDTATGRTWKYDRDARYAADEPVWTPLRFPEQAKPAPAAARPVPQEAPAEESWFAPGPYKDKRPGGK